MDESELVMNIVFSMDNTFADLSISDCRNIFNIFPSFRQLNLNQNIRESFDKYSSEYIYEKLFEHVRISSYLYLIGCQDIQTYIDDNKEIMEEILSKSNRKTIQDINTRKHKLLKYTYYSDTYNLYHTYQDDLDDTYEMQLYEMIDAILNSYKRYNEYTK